MKAHLIVFLCCLAAGAYSKCLRAPVGKLPEGCQVGNLTVTMHPSKEIINHIYCNITVDQSSFNYAPARVGFQQIRPPVAPSYLLTAVDLTTKQLLWMVTNLTVLTDWRIYPSGNTYSREILIFHKPAVSQYSPKHVIEFQVFEEHRIHPSRTYYITNAIHSTPFNLSTWIDSQQNSGITLCGPVAGGSVVAFQQAPAPAPAPGPGPVNPPSSPNRKNSSDRVVVDAMMIFVAFVFVFYSVSTL